MATSTTAVLGTLPASDPPRAEPRRRGRRALLVMSVLFVVVGLTLFLVSAFAPDFVERVTGEAKVAVEKQVQTLVAPEELPVIRLGVEGGVREMDRCDGTFTEMVAYRIDGVLPLFAAHHRCGGDIILGWELGQRVRVEGSDTVYEVIEERHTPKWENVNVLKGMTGEFMVQTCYYGQNKMRFLALAPVSDPSAAEKTHPQASGPGPHGV